MHRIIVVCALVMTAGCYTQYDYPSENRPWAPPAKPAPGFRKYAVIEEDMARAEVERAWTPPPKPGRSDLDERIARIERRMEELLDLAQKMGGKENEEPEDSNPKIAGQIVGVSNRINLVVINVGEEDGVRVGFEFTIHRKGEFLGKLVVAKVYPRQSACRVTSSLDGMKVHQGDKVTARVTGSHTRKDVETPMPDGRIVRADVDQGYAYIDLGGKDGVRAGMRFHVYSVLKGGRRRPKGEIRIIRVEKDFCQCSILTMLDQDDPITMGDYIWNKFFVAGRKLIFVFVGKFGGEHVQWTREQLTKLVQSAGHIASDKVNPDAHYAVLGEDYKKDPEYELVEDWRIDKVKPRDLFDYFGFGRFK
ncbi:MAG: hypothetical protein ACYS47_12305 [Planctomycetota bacterium]